MTGLGKPGAAQEASAATTRHDDVALAMRAKLRKQASVAQSKPPRAALFERLKDFIEPVKKAVAARPKRVKAPTPDPVTVSSQESLDPAPTADELEQDQKPTVEGESPFGKMSVNDEPGQAEPAGDNEGVTAEDIETESDTSSAETVGIVEQNQTDATKDEGDVAAAIQDIAASPEDDDLTPLEDDKSQALAADEEEGATNEPSIEDTSDEITEKNPDFSFDASKHFAQSGGNDAPARPADRPDWLTVDRDPGELTAMLVNDHAATPDKTPADNESATVPAGCDDMDDSGADAPTETTVTEKPSAKRGGFSYDVSRHFCDGNKSVSKTYEVFGPSWLTIDSESGALSGTPGAADEGSVVVTVTATKECGTEASATLSLRVADDADERVVVTGTREG